MKCTFCNKSYPERKMWMSGGGCHTCPDCQKEGGRPAMVPSVQSCPKRAFCPNAPMGCINCQNHKRFEPS